MNENDFRLYHHGIQGQKWGVRRYQNEDGTYTAEGKSRYSKAARIANKVPIISAYNEWNRFGKSVGTKAGEKLVSTHQARVEKRQQKAEENAVKRQERNNMLKRSSGSRDSDTLREARKKDINQLSNKELKEYNERLQLERQYADLTKGKINSGKNYVGKMANSVVTGIIVGVAVSEGSKYVKDKFLNK